MHDVTTRQCVVADLGPGVIDGDLDRLLQVLQTLAAWEREAAQPAGDGWCPPGVLAGPTGLETVEGLRAALHPTQTSHRDGGDIEPPGPRWYATDGRYQLAALSWITVEVADVALLAAIGAELGRPGGDYDVREAIEQVADAMPGHRGRDRHTVVMSAAWIAGMLALAPTADAAQLHQAHLRAVAAGGDVVLTAADEAAYHRTVDRITAAVAPRDPLTRWAMGSRGHG